MQFEIRNVGLIGHASITIDKLTIICGENNTGKTYVTYALYGFLRNWRQMLQDAIEPEIKEALTTTSGINLHEIFTGRVNQYLAKIATQYATVLPYVFASDRTFFENASVNVTITSERPLLDQSYQRSLKDINGKTTLAILTKKKGSPLLDIIIADTAQRDSSEGLLSYIVEAIADIIFAPNIPDVFIASAERTGAAIFRKELDFARNRLVQELGRQDTKNLRNPLHLLERMEVGYPWPVQENVDFVRQLEDIDKQISPLSELFPEAMQAFESVIGGSYKVVKGKGLYYVPKGATKTKLSMSESSSSVRALLDIGFYLRCRAKAGDLLIIDEPELNLHPVNQRALARLLARLVNYGIRVFMTTHSDYIVKELNTLIMLHQATPHTESMRKKYQYDEAELVDPQHVKLFMTSIVSAKRDGSERKTKFKGLVEAKIDAQQGIEVDTFDTTIDEMNEMQTEILFGDDN
jgi:predicted ATPase